MKKKKKNEFMHAEAYYVLHRDVLRSLKAAVVWDVFLELHQIVYKGVHLKVSRSGTLNMTMAVDELVAYESPHLGLGLYLNGGA